MNLDFDKSYYALINVIGIGGGGSNAINRMMDDNLSGCEFVAINTDAQALMMSNADKKILIGETGLGAGSDPEIGRIAAEKSIDVIKEVVEVPNYFDQLYDEYLPFKEWGVARSRIKIDYLGEEEIPLYEHGEMKLTLSRYRGFQCGVRYAEAYLAMDKRVIGKRILQKIVESD